MGIAHWLRARGAGHCGNVGGHLPPNALSEMVAGLLGILKSGAAYDGR